MPAAATTTNQSTTAVGFEQRTVVVSQVVPERNICIVIDNKRIQSEVSYLTQRAKGRLPKEGETWLIDRAFGIWTFAAYVGGSADAYLIQAEDIAPGVIGDTTTVPDGSITTPKIAANAVTPPKIPDASLTRSKMVPGTLTGAEIQDGSLTGTEIADTTLARTKLVPGTLTGAEVQDGSLTGAEIADASLARTKLVPATLTGAEIQDASVPGTKLQTGTVTGTQIQDNSITPTELNLSSLRPVVTAQAGDPAFNFTSTWVEFSAANWPYAVFTAPSSGQVKITLSGYLQNTSTTGATCRLSWNLINTTTSATVDAARIQMGILGTNPAQPSSYVKHYAGLVAGNGYAVHVAWYISSGSASTASAKEGQLIVDLIA